MFYIFKIIFLNSLTKSFKLYKTMLIIFPLSNKFLMKDDIVFSQYFEISSISKLFSLCLCCSKISLIFLSLIFSISYSKKVFNSSFLIFNSINFLFSLLIFCLFILFTSFWKFISSSCIFFHILLLSFFFLLLFFVSYHQNFF